MCGIRGKDCEFENFNLIVTSIGVNGISHEKTKRVCKHCFGIEGSTHDWREYISSLEAMQLRPAFSKILV